MSPENLAYIFLDGTHFEAGFSTKVIAPSAINSGASPAVFCFARFDHSMR